MGGAQLYAHLLAQRMTQAHAVKVVCQWDTNRTDWLLGTTVRAPTDDRDYVIDGVPVHRMGLSLSHKLHVAPFLPIYYPMMQMALPRIADRLEECLEDCLQGVDVIHNVRIGREGLSYASLLAARRHGIPFVFTPLHHPRWVGWRYNAYIRLYRSADAVLALTQAEKRVLVGLGVREERVFVTGMGPVLAQSANPVDFQREHGIDGPVVLFVGQHYRYKGYGELLRAAPLVWQKLPEVHFVFIGPPVGQSERDYEPFKDRRIHRLGQVSLQVKTDALAACALLCLPSTQESFGGVYTEAWSFGKPVIGCDIPAVAEVIDDGVDGCLVAQEPAEIAERILDLLTDASRATRMGDAGKRKVEERYTWRMLAERTEQAYRAALCL
jgi:glycosyltransferase involved in cell wall biosynthesis